MTSQLPSQSFPAPVQRLLQAINLRSGEVERTLLMFAFYTVTSMGMSWLEVSSAALFLDLYGAALLPWIYIFSALIGFSLSAIYTWMQRIFPLRWVIVVISLMMALPLLAFRWGLGLPLLAGVMVFVMRLWMEAIYGLNDLNLSVTANQLFNIREIKRAFPLVSSGNLLADVFSGFSIALLLRLVGIENMLLLACGFMVLGSGILTYLSQTYQHAFPDSPKRQLEETNASFSARRFRGPVRQYIVLLFSFFVLAQVLLYLIEFQYLDQLTSQEFSVNAIASFLGLFTGSLGLMQLVTQWFTSSRLIERTGVFTVTMLLPAVVSLVGLASLFVSLPMVIGGTALFIGVIVLKFLDEWLRYTLVASTRPILFQPIPDQERTGIQSMVGGIAEPASMCVTGIGILITISLLTGLGINEPMVRGQIFLTVTVIGAVVWLGVVWLLRSRYLNILVLSAERGLLTFSDANLPMLKRAFIEQLEQPGTEAEKSSCIELIANIDPQRVGDVLAPMLDNLSPRLQRQSLEAMLDYPNPFYLPQVRSLIRESRQPEVLALALRYVWITEASPDINALRPYLRTEVDPIVRGTAASLMLRRGNPQQKAEATQTLRKMLTHSRERERVMGCRALGEAEYMQIFRLEVPRLLQDESLRVRRALLNAIAATRLEDFYPSLLRGLQYKSTRDAAADALVRLGNEALPMLVALAEDAYKPEPLRAQAWLVIGRIDSTEAEDILVTHLMTAWGNTRRCLLRILLKRANESGLQRSRGIDAAFDRLGRAGLEQLLNQELILIGQVYAALLDITPERVVSTEADLLRGALQEIQTDAVERLFMLMRFLGPSGTIQAAQISLQGSASSRARGLEILDTILDIPNKRAVLSVLDRRPDLEKLQSLSGLVSYQPLNASDRLRYLLDLRHFLSDWTLACCFHVARRHRWSLTSEQTLACLRHPTGFVREAVLSYLQMASPRALAELLPLLKDDPNPLVAAQVRQLAADLGPGMFAPSV
jgi:ATP/ADP translocase/HEAT repeat protein